jgi:hypothetical protein
MHIISTLSNHDFLRIEDVLNQNVEDVYAYLQYLDAKVRAENVQQKYINDLNKNKRK